MHDRLDLLLEPALGHGHQPGRVTAERGSSREDGRPKKSKNLNKWDQKKKKKPQTKPHIYGQSARPSPHIHTATGRLPARGQIPMAVFFGIPMASLSSGQGGEQRTQGSPCSPCSWCGVSIPVTRMLERTVREPQSLPSRLHCPSSHGALVYCTCRKEQPQVGELGGLRDWQTGRAHINTPRRCASLVMDFSAPGLLNVLYRRGLDLRYHDALPRAASLSVACRLLRTRAHH